MTYKFMVNVEIITIGDELLIGQVIDTNSAWIAQELNRIGFDILYKSTVGDNEKDILDAFDKAFSRVSVVLVTGGITRKSEISILARRRNYPVENNRQTCFGTGFGVSNGRAKKQITEVFGQ